MWIPLFGLLTIVGTIVIAAYSHQPWLGFWEHIGETSHDTRHKTQ